MFFFSFQPNFFRFSETAFLAEALFFKERPSRNSKNTCRNSKKHLQEFAKKQKACADFLHNFKKLVRIYLGVKPRGPEVVLASGKLGSLGLGPGVRAWTWGYWDILGQKFEKHAHKLKKNKKTKKTKKLKSNSDKVQNNFGVRRFHIEIWKSNLAWNRNLIFGIWNRYWKIEIESRIQLRIKNWCLKIGMESRIQIDIEILIIESWESRFEKWNWRWNHNWSRNSETRKLKSEIWEVKLKVESRLKSKLETRNLKIDHWKSKLQVESKLKSET